VNHLNPTDEWRNRTSKGEKRRQKGLIDLGKVKSGWNVDLYLYKGLS